MPAFRRVLLIKPLYHQSHYADYIWLPAGLGYVSEALSRADISNTVVDMQLGYDLPRLKKRIREFSPDLIGLSMMTFGYKHTYRLIEELKGAFPQVPIAVGGPHISTIREKALEECLSIDYGVVLEGDETIVELCRGNVSLPEIRGLLYRDSEGRVAYTGDRLFIRDLDRIGFATYSQFELEAYSTLSIVSSRGCPYQCIYCPIRRTIGSQFRFRSAESVAEEFEYWYKRGRRYFGLADDNFTLRTDRVFEVCDQLENRQLSGIHVSLGNGVRADRVNREMLRRMKQVGFDSLAFGVEAGNNKVLARLKKAERIETIEQAIRDACELGYQVTLFFLLGSPEETEADVQDSVNLALRHPVYDARFYNLIPFPHTELFQWVSENRYFVKPPEDYLNYASHWVNEPVFETPELPLAKRRRLYKWANNVVKWHCLKTKGRFHRAGVASKFERLGFPAPISRFLSSLYWSRPFQFVMDTKLLTEVKRNINA